jgi:hypothetical protein
MVRVTHLPRYFPPATRRLHIAVSHRLKLRGPIGSTTFSPSFVNNSHFIKNFNAGHKDRISHVAIACYNSSPCVSLCTPNFKIKRRFMRRYSRTCSTDHKCLHSFIWKISREKYQEPERRWCDNIEIHLKRKSLNDAHWIHLAQDMYQGTAVVNTGMKFRALLDTNKSTWIAKLLSEFLDRLFQVVSRV